MRVKDVLQALDAICPFSLQEDWDNSGLQVGDEMAEVRRILVAFDYTEDILAEAISRKVDLIVTHHPYFYHPIGKINVAETKGRLIAGLIRNDIALVACHTNLDKINYGVSAVLGQRLGLTYCHPFLPEANGNGFGVRGTLPKAVTFGNFAEMVRDRLGLRSVRCVGRETEPVRTVVAMGGAGAEFMKEAKAQGADVYVSADFKYHDGQTAKEMGLFLVDAGHFGTEMPIVEVFAEKIKTVLPEIKIIVSERMKDFWHIC